MYGWRDRCMKRCMYVWMEGRKDGWLDELIGG
jgi:hypothetical protein